MEARQRQLIRRGCLTQLLHTFTISFFAFHAVFEILIMALSTQSSGLTADMSIPGLSPHASFFTYSIAGVILYLAAITGIVLILRSKKGGIYILYSSGLLLITYYLIKDEPDWYSALILAIIIIFYVLALHLIRSHSKLEEKSLHSPEKQEA